MASFPPALEPITSEPVIISAYDAQNPTSANANDHPTPNNNNNTNPAKTARRVAFQEEVKPIIEANRPLVKRPRHQEIIPVNDASTLTSLLSEPDLLVEVPSTGLVYIVNHAFSAEDLDHFSWLFTIAPTGIENWIPKPDFYGPPYANGSRYDYERRDGSTPIARLGASLRVFHDTCPEAKEAKFVMAVQKDGCPGLVKQVISYSPKAAAVNIFYEILNGNSILFVAGLPKEVPLPVPVDGLNRTGGKGLVFQRVGSVREAEECKEDVIGVVC